MVRIPVTNLGQVQSFVRALQCLINRRQPPDIAIGLDLGLMAQIKSIEGYVADERALSSCRD